MYRQWVRCERNSSYNFIPIFLKLCTCFLHGLKMCTWFGYNPCINFCNFFHFSELCHFLTLDSIKVYRHWVPCERNSSYNFIPIFMKLCTCFCPGLEMCTWFEYNPWINFCHFFHFVNFVIFWPQILWKCIDSGYLVSATPYTISCLSLCNFAHLFFFHGLKMCMWFGFNPAVNFCNFSSLLTLSFFAGATSTSPKFDEFEFWPEQISHFRVMCPWGWIKVSIDLLWNLQVQLTFQMKIYWVPCGRNSS